MTAEFIKRCVARTMGIRIEDLNSARRTRKFAWPRQVAMYLCVLDNRTTREAAQAFGCHHTNIIHARRKVEMAIVNKGHPGHKDAVKIQRLKKTICP